VTSPTVPFDINAVPQAAASADDRLPPLAEGDMTPAQLAAVAEFRDGRGQAIGGPYVPLLRSPEVFLACNRLGRHLRFNGVLDKRLSELAIIVTARRWTQGYEWYAHRRIAEHAGLSPAICDAVAEGRIPDAMAGDEAAVYAFATELHLNGQVSDLTYARATAIAGETGVVELAAVCGYYTLLAMVMNVARTPLPEGVAEELTPFRG